MSESIFTALAPVRLRQRLLFALQAMGWGTLLSAAIGLIWGTGRLLANWSTPMEGIITLMVVGPVLGFIVGWFWQHSWRSAAAAVDSQAQLKDRTVSASNFCRNLLAH